MKNITLDFLNPDVKIFVIFLILALTLIYAFRKSGKKRGAKPIFILRMSILTLALFLFAQPVLKWKTQRVQKPVAELWIDNSQSIARNESIDQKAYQQNIDHLAAILREKEMDVRLRAFGVDDRIIKNTNLLNLTKEATNISQLFRHYEEPIEVAVLISDGQYNTGENPMTMKFPNRFPVFCVGVGDTIKKLDAEVVSVKSPLTVKKDESFRVSAEIRLPESTENYTVLLLKNDEIINSRILNPAGKDFLQTVEFQVQAAEVGETELAVEIENSQDKNPHNNKKLQLVNVLPGAKKILMLCSGPSFETGALMDIFSDSEDFQAQILYLKDKKWFPSPEILNEAFDLIILLDFPDKGVPNADVATKISELPKIIYIDKSTNLKGLASLMKAPALTAFVVNTIIGSVRENSGGKGFGILRDISQKTDWSNLPPIALDFQRVNLPEDFKILLESNENNARPVVVFSEKKKLALMLGQDFWRWKNMTESPNYTQLMHNMARYLTENTETSNIQVTTEKKIYLQGETAILSGHIFDMNGMNISTADVRVEIVKDSTVIDDFFMNWQQDHFHGKYIFRQPGKYQIAVKANKNGYSLGEKKLEILVEERVLEYLNTGLNDKILRHIAEVNNGKYVEIHHLKQFAGTINGEPDIKIRNRELVFDKNIGVFLLLVLLLTGEWILRKYLGYL